MSFIAVDNNIPYYDTDGNEMSHCDAMIYTKQTLIFIELKNQAKDWISESIEQLKSTIKHFDETDGLDKFRFKKAYACNKAHQPNTKIQTATAESLNHCQFQFHLRQQRHFPEVTKSM